jgi:hypothetical protein
VRPGRVPRPASQPSPAQPAEPLPKRVPQRADSGNGARSGLASRVPGANLTHRPNPAEPPRSAPRPRPERVQEMLTRHQRGVKEGRDDRGDRP